MPHYKLTYFDFDGGRGEPIRIAFHVAGIAFEDNRLNFEQFNQMRQGTTFSSLPVLEIDGVPVTQSNAICRFVGNMAGLYPADAMQALYCDEVLEAQEDLAHYIVPTFGLRGDELRLAREKLVDGWMTRILSGLGELIERGGEYLADNRLTVADLKVAGLIQWLNGGHLDHVPADLVERVAPALNEHARRVFDHPVVKAYYAANPQ